MVISYSGIVNYGKSTQMASADSWGTQMVIVRDPPKSIHTRMKTRVGDTSAVTATLADADDRFCENINYYARGQNPMVSVSYGEGVGGSHQPYLPYRVARDGAFRPPIWRQEDLLPLSRLPRHRTSVTTNLKQIDYTRRLTDCGGDITKEIRSDLLQMHCEAKKSIEADPDVCTPITTRMTRERLSVGVAKPNLSFGLYGGKCGESSVDCRTVIRDDPIHTTASTNRNAAVSSKLGRDEYESSIAASKVKNSALLPVVEHIDFSAVLPKRWDSHVASDYSRLLPIRRGDGSYATSDRSRM